MVAAGQHLRSAMSTFRRGQRASKRPRRRPQSLTAKPSAGTNANNGSGPLRIVARQTNSDHRNLRMQAFKSNKKAAAVLADAKTKTTAVATSPLNNRRPPRPGLRRRHSAASAGAQSPPTRPRAAGPPTPSLQNAVDAVESPSPKTERAVRHLFGERPLYSHEAQALS